MLSLSKEASDANDVLALCLNVISVDLRCGDKCVASC